MEAGNRTSRAGPETVTLQPGRHLSRVEALNVRRMHTTQPPITLNIEAVSAPIRHRPLTRRALFRLGRRA